MSDPSEAQRERRTRVGLLLGLTLAAVAFWFAVFARPPDPGESHFALQADAFLRGEIFVDVSGERSRVDYTRQAGRFSIPWGPLPAVLLVPGVSLFGPRFPQTALALVLNVLNLALAVVLAQRLGYARRDALLAGVALVAASPYLATATALFSSWLTNLAATACLLLALVELAGRSRFLLVGAYVGLAGLARPTLFVSGAFFLGAIWLARPGLRVGLRGSMALALPIVLMVGVLAAFNHARFGSFAEPGYRYQVLPREYKDARREGLFDLSNSVGYFTDLVLALPARRGSSDPQTAPGGQNTPTLARWRMSLFLTSPYLLSLLFLSPRRQPRALLAVASAFLVAIPSSLWFHPGALEYGNRFAIDFFPLLLFAFLCHHGGAFPRWVRGVVLAAAWANLVLCTLYVIDRFG